LRTKSTASITIWTTNAAMPPRDPERKMLAAISAAIPAPDFAAAFGKAGCG